MTMTPHDLDIERSVLGSLLVSSSGLLDVIARIRPEHFYREAHQDIYRAICALHSRRESIDLVTVCGELTRTHGLDGAGGPAYVSQLTDGIPRNMKLLHHTDKLLDLSARRRVQVLCRELVDTIDEAAELEPAAHKLVEEIREVVTVSQADAPTLGSAVEAYLASADTPEDVIPTGLLTLDSWGCGFRTGELIILAGRPSHGKSALALVLARAASEKVPVWFVSLEMTRQSLAQRAVASEAGIELTKLRSGEVEDPDWPKLRAAMDRLRPLRLHLDDRGGQTVSDIRRAVAGKRGIVVIDYLQLLRPPREAMAYGNRVQEVGAISRSLKSLAHEHGVTVVALSQLSRQVESRSDKTPQLSDLRESGEIEQDADQVWFLWRPPLYDEGELVDRACLKVAKHRNGPTGTVELVFEATTQSVRERRATDPQPQPQPVVSARAQAW